jgi:hypothetical protein
VESGERKNMTLRDLLEANINESVIAQIMVKVIEKVMEETSKGRFMLYTPDHIHLNGFSPSNV